MMQPTPAPSSAPNSPGPQQQPEDEPITSSHPTAPQNMGSAPFSILVGLFEKLQAERKQDRRKKMIDAWFNVRFASASLEENTQDGLIALAR
jgi:DNA ligase 4